MTADVPPTLTVQQRAMLDQAHAAGNKDLDGMVRDLRQRIAEENGDTTVAIAIFTAELQVMPWSRRDLAALAGLAVGRLAQAEARDA